MSDEVKGVPFNDLSRIHLPLLEQFKNGFVELIENSNLVLGSEVALFEEELAQAEDCEYAIGVNSGTSAIELALRALDIGPGDEVITTAFTFVATCFAILQTGAIPVLIDIDPLTGLLDPTGIERVITPKTKALILVTMHGRVEGLEQIRNICNTHNLRFIIDAAQSHLGTFDGEPQSNFCDAATLSFYPGKNLGALGEGGAVLTNSHEIKERVSIMRDWGAQEKYNHVAWGGNFRLESLQASVLRIKLRELKNWTIQRRQIAKIYQESLNPDFLMKPTLGPGSHVYHIYSIHTQHREQFLVFLSQHLIGYGLHYPKTIHQQPAYANRVLTPVPLINSEWLANATVSIPIFPGQSSWEIDKVIAAINKA